MDRRKILLILLLELWHLETTCACTILVLMMLKLRRRHIERRSLNNRSLVRRETRLRYLDSIIGNSDIKCVNELRMDRRTFGLLCDLLRQDGRVKNDGLVSLEEQVCVFLHVLPHHVKNRAIGSRFFRSGETISRYFNSVLQGVLRLQDILLKVPDPVRDNCEDSRWRRFKNCLGALDGTYIKVRVAEIDKPRYRTRKGEIRYFGLIKARWGILRSPSFYPIKTQCQIITACCLLHNLIRREMSIDPIEHEINELEDGENMVEGMESGTVHNSKSSMKKETRRKWLPFEEDALLTILEDFVTRGHRCDTEFGKIMQMVTEAIVKGNEDRSEIAKMLKDMGLSPMDQIDALTLILEKPQTVAVFQSLDDDVKEVFVQKLLNDHARG
ncbi:uncharacterized protein LOC117630461 [Prunus dulcis]|uniref:uncharacterized protein LOC117630461 n=1 Tax=Prunus dulcis TaxID=3755 RepID=UPI001482C6E1|nr:uncharacterized protein LOC117630461 [Prunus dulcis]